MAVGVKGGEKRAAKRERKGTPIIRRKNRSGHFPNSFPSSKQMAALHLLLLVVGSVDCGGGGGDGVYVDDGTSSPFVLITSPSRGLLECYERI